MTDTELIFKFDKEDNFDDNFDLSQFDLSLTKKKKKKVVEENIQNIHNIQKKVVENDFEEYDYVYLLDRFFLELREKHPSLASRKIQVIPPPILQRVGKKTMWTNFSIIVSVLKRTIEHIQSYISYEMSTECSVDGNSRLLIKGKFDSKNIETVLKNYIIEYVSCYLCKGLDTSIIKDPLTRVCFIKCDTCKSSRSVSQIKKTFCV